MLTMQIGCVEMRIFALFLIKQLCFFEKIE